MMWTMRPLYTCAHVSENSYIICPAYYIVIYFITHICRLFYNSSVKRLHYCPHHNSFLKQLQRIRFWDICVNHFHTSIVGGYLKLIFQRDPNSLQRSLSSFPVLTLIIKWDTWSSNASGEAFHTIEIFSVLYNCKWNVFTQ